MKDRPPMNLVGMDGNIFFVMGMASKVLKQHGMEENAKEMFERVKHSGNYYKALGIISEYVQTEISRPDPGILEPEDIGIDPEFFLALDGVTAYVETWFDTAERFGVLLGSDDSIDRNPACAVSSLRAEHDTAGDGAMRRKTAYQPEGIICGMEIGTGQKADPE